MSDGQGSAAAHRGLMRTAAEKISSAASNTRGLKANLASDITALTAQGWEGTSARAFAAVFVDFDNQFGRVLDALDGIHETLVGSRVAFEQNEEVQAQQVNTLNALLNQ